MRTRVKICGITRAEDGLAAAEAGADAIGLVFHAKSPRNIDVAQASAIRAALPPFLTVVGLFVDAERERVEEILRAVRLDLLQFHGRETPAQCLEFGIPYIKAIRMHDDVDLRAEVERHPRAAGLLLDAHAPDREGGTGRSFDWSRVPRDLGKPVILAGGLNPGNVAEAVARVRPYAVDVSSGVEAAPGIKDAQKMAAFVRNARGLA